MPDYNIVLPSKPRVIKEEGSLGIYEIDGLHPGYGHTLGNSLRRIILSSLPGAAITSIKIEGVEHEFSTLEGVKEDVVAILLNLKKLRFTNLADGQQKAELKKSSIGEVKGGDLKLPSQLKLANPDQTICHVTKKGATLQMELSIEKGIGYVSREILHKDKVDIGIIALDAAFSPIRRVNYEVENMRVGERTDFNRLRIFIESDGSISPSQALESAISILINQLKAILGFQEEHRPGADFKTGRPEVAQEELETETKVLKTKIEDLKLSQRTFNALSKAALRTVSGLARKTEADLLELSGLGEKGIGEIKRALSQFGLTLKQE